ncbi:Hypothetical predicted protein [Cloeon dipterum]|uniref:GH18 domain-containing protein n=1 Tax=Cloeon dipterum TaxID=197152 RepID=A0A8S1C2Z3_9INSE|nr:Hypothetical predicted protein [Cloeon dipterum]
MPNPPLEKVNSKYCFMENTWNISPILSEKGQPLCDILVMPVAVFNKETNLLQMKTENWSMASLALESAKKSGMKVMLRVGSYGDPKELTRVAKSEQLKAKFVQGVVEFVRKYDFDGITISWIWKVAFSQGICTQDIDRKSVVSFLRALATPFNATGKTVIYHMNGFFNTIMVAGDYFSEIIDVIDYFYFECHLQTPGDWFPTTNFSLNLKKTRDLINELMTKIKKGSEFRRKLVLTIQPNYKNYELSDQKTLKIGTVFVKNSQMKKSLIMSEWCKLIKDPRSILRWRLEPVWGCMISLLMM